MLEKQSELTNKDIMVNTWLFNHFHGTHWNKGYSALQDVIVYLPTTLQKGNNYTLSYILKEIKKLSG